MWVRRAEMVDVECVARGYISGSGWKDYKRTGAICGIPLPAGLRESDALPEPIFTPATKATSGHDENISFEDVSAKIGAELAGKLRDLTLAIYKKAADYARTRGIIIADTKFEFGIIDGRDNAGGRSTDARFLAFLADGNLRPGWRQPSYDKQYVRDYLESIHWNKQPPAPSLPDDVARRTSEKYKEAYRVLTRKELVNLLDIILVVIVAASVITGFLAGFARVGIGFLATIAGLLLGFWFYGIPAAWIHDHGVHSEAASNLLGFFLVFLACTTLGHALGEVDFEALQVDRSFLAGPADGRRVRLRARKPDRHRAGGGAAGLYAQAAAELGDRRRRFCRTRSTRRIYARTWRRTRSRTRFAKSMRDIRKAWERAVQEASQEAAGSPENGSVNRPMARDLLIFDLDGTLIDSQRDLVDSVNATRVWAGLPALSDELVASYVGNGAPMLIRSGVSRCEHRRTGARC